MILDRSQELQAFLSPFIHANSFSDRGAAQTVAAILNTVG